MLLLLVSSRGMVIQRATGWCRQPTFSPEPVPDRILGQRRPFDVFSTVEDGEEVRAWSVWPNCESPYGVSQLFRQPGKLVERPVLHRRVKVSGDSARVPLSVGSRRLGKRA